MKIYVAGPYTAGTMEEMEANVQTAIGIGIAILKKGHTPFIPHLTHYVELHAKEKGITFTWDDYMAWDEIWLAECDALYFIAPSRGASLERGIAERMKIPVFERIEEVPAI